MAPAEDRLSILPDDLLHIILHLLPLKSAIRTSVLAHRWRPLWVPRLAAVDSFDFGVDFALSQTDEKLVDTVRRYLRIHGDKPLHRFALCFFPDERYARDMESWARAVVAKGVKELELDFSVGVIEPAEPFLLPGDVFFQSLLEHLQLKRCNIASPLDFSGLAALQSLSLDRVDIDDGMLQELLSSCLLLVSLTLSRCNELHEVVVRGQDLALRTLILLHCDNMGWVDFSVPNLETFILCRPTCLLVSFLSRMKAMNDAYIYVEDTEVELEHVRMLSDLQHVKILTMCSTGLMFAVYDDGFGEDYDEEDIDEYFHEGIEQLQPLEMLNLQELQLLMKTFGGEQIGYIFRFFNRFNCPFVERLFIQLPDDPADVDGFFNLPGLDNEPWDITFYYLTFIKIYNYRGSQSELTLVALLLQKAIYLETLVIVAPFISYFNYNESSEQLFALPRASSLVQIVLSGFDNAEEGENPTHQKYCHRELLHF